MVVYSAIKGPHGTAGGRLRTRVEGIMMLFVTLPGFIACICFFGYDDDTSGGSVSHFRHRHLCSLARGVLTMYWCSDAGYSSCLVSRVTSLV